MSDTNSVAVDAQASDIPVTEAPPEPSLPPPPAGPKKLEESDVLKLENYFLKIDNVRKGGENLRKDAMIAEMQLRELQTGLTNFREQLSQKYGVDLKTARITPDGTIIPNAMPVATNGAGNPIGAALSPMGIVGRG